MRPVPSTLALILAAAISLAPAHATAGDIEPYMERSEKSVDASGLRGLSITNPRGRVALAPSADGRIHVMATKIVRAGRREDIAEYAAQCAVETYRRNGRFEIEVKYPRRIESHVDFWDFFSERGRKRLQFPKVEVRLEIQLPATLAASVSSTSGDLMSRGLAGEQSLGSTSGDIEIQGARAAVDVHSVSGSIEIQDAANTKARTTSGDIAIDGAGTVEVASTSGDVSVDGARGGVSVETVSGDIVIGDAPHGVRAHSTSGELVIRGACERVDAGSLSGDIRARVRAPLNDVSCTSTSGDVSVELVTGLGANLSARSTSGSIDCQVSAVVLKHGRNSLEAKVGPGGAPMRLETTSGNVTISGGGK